ncbi:MAG: 2,3,4,5-tetrahydropyridine-2,6-dicarboxylate N-succinyltransferase [Gemmatimonadota bacterium]
MSEAVAELRREIERFAAGVPPNEEAAARAAFGRLKDSLHAGEVRAAERAPDGTWQVNAWVKAGILLGFRLGRSVVVPAGRPFSFVDKDTYPVREFSDADGVRIVPGGSTIREGAYVARGVICMPPMYVNVGAYVDSDTMIDSHALVGSCAQIGKRVHLSAGAQIGGVLEPAGALPVIVEDGALIGGNCGVYEGTIIRAGAVLAPGTILSGGTAVVDLVHDKVYRREGNQPLEIPEGAVVVPGSRPIKSGPGATRGVSLYTPVIVKYRDDRTDASTQLEDLLR